MRGIATLVTYVLNVLSVVKKKQDCFHEEVFELLDPNEYWSHRMITTKTLHSVCYYETNAILHVKSDSKDKIVKVLQPQITFKYNEDKTTGGVDIKYYVKEIREQTGAAIIPGEYIRHSSVVADISHCYTNGAANGWYDDYKNKLKDVSSYYYFLTERDL